MDFKKIDGVKWTVSEVAKFESADDFVKHFMAEPNIYENFKPERKERALKLVYAACVPEVAKAEPAAAEPVQAKQPRKRTVGNQGEEAE